MNVADASDERVDHWLDEEVDLGRVYAEIWKDAAPTHLVDVAATVTRASRRKRGSPRIGASI